MIFSWHDASAIAIIAAYALTCSLAWWIPLTAWWQDSKQAFKWSMPISFSIQILIGYIFYCFAQVMWFMPVYAGIVVLMNIVTIVLWRQRLQTLLRWPKLTLWYWLLGVLALGVTIYVRLYDPVQTLAPGNNDTANHLGFLYDLYKLGYLSNPYYAPGYHLIMGPLTLVLDQISVYRWVGPVFSIIFAGGMYAFVRDYLKHSLVRWLYVLGSSSYILHQWILQTMGLFSSALTFIYLIAFLSLLTETIFSWQRRVLVYAVLGVALAVSVPYFFIQFIFVVLMLFLLALGRRSLQQWRYYGVCLCLTALCIGIGVGHVYLQTKLLQRGGGFPEVPIITKDDNNQVSLKSNFDDAVTEHPNDALVPDPSDALDQSDDTTVVTEPSTGSQLSLTDQLIQQIDRYDRFGWYQKIRPLILTAIDILAIKQLRPAQTFLSIGAYLWIVLAMAMLIIGLWRRLLPWVGVATASIMYGFAIQTGSLELSFYRGRSGWYLLFLALLGSVLILDRYYRPKLKWPLLITGLLVAVVNVRCPPAQYRPYYQEVFDAAWLHIPRVNDTRPVIISRQPLLQLLYPKALILPYDVSTLTLSEAEKNLFLIYEKEFYPVDPILSQQALSGDVNFKEFQDKQTVLKNMFEQTNQAIQESPAFAHYSLLWENDHIAIYQRILP